MSANEKWRITVKFVYRLKNRENGYVWGNFSSADAAFDTIASDPTYVCCDIQVIRVQVD